MAKFYNAFAGSSIERIAALSDGLFAIAMTLIVLEVHVPEAHGIANDTALLGALVDLAPRMLTYVLSFLTLGIFWVGQQTQLNHLKRADRDLSWLHLLFLALIATMPFSTSLLANFITFRLALVIYWLNILVLGVVLFFTWSYAQRHQLVDDDLSPEASAAICRRIIIAQSLYAFGAALCVYNTYWSIGFIVLVQLNYVIAPRLPWLERI